MSSYVSHDPACRGTARRRCPRGHDAGGRAERAGVRPVSPLRFLHSPRRSHDNSSCRTPAGNRLAARQGNLRAASLSRASPRRTVSCPGGLRRPLRRPGARSCGQLLARGRRRGAEPRPAPGTWGCAVVTPSGSTAGSSDSSRAPMEAHLEDEGPRSPSPAQHSVIAFSSRWFPSRWNSNCRSRARAWWASDATIAERSEEGRPGFASSHSIHSRIRIESGYGSHPGTKPGGQEASQSRTSGSPAAAGLSHNHRK
jgi:hypothetical protein